MLGRGAGEGRNDLKTSFSTTPPRYRLYGGRLHSVPTDESLEDQRKEGLPLGATPPYLKGEATLAVRSVNRNTPMQLAGKAVAHRTRSRKGTRP